jgi:hypothetical protein
MTDERPTQERRTHRFVEFPPGTGEAICTTCGQNHDAAARPCPGPRPVDLAPPPPSAPSPGGTPDEATTIAAQWSQQTFAELPTPLEDISRIRRVLERNETALARDIRAALASARSAREEAERERQRDAAEARVRELEAAARRCLEASKQGVSEAEGMRRLDALANLVAYDAGPAPKVGLPPPTSTDFDAMAAEMKRLGDVFAYEGEAHSPGWAFAVFAFVDRPDPQNGHVLHIARDRDQSLAAVSKWVMERLEARKAGARG